jgi:hypothetical protein
MALYKRGRCAGRCDANCYNALGQICKCICAGLNHGKGKALATKQTRTALEGLQKLHRESHDYHASQRLIFPLEVRQHNFLAPEPLQHEAHRTTLIPLLGLEYPG